ncbi:MAG TPA: AAA family ATPase [Kiloniellales bacterium]|nr:AAA family ATPase [Kiloniellales bacterium]
MAMAGVGIKLRLLGEMEVHCGSRRVELPPSRKSRALLAYLAATARPQRREKLCGMLWELPDDPRGALRWSLSRLRAALGERSCLIADRETVALDVSHCFIDLLAVRALERDGIATARTAQLLEAAEFFRGDFLEGLELSNSNEFQSWCLVEREDLRRLNVKILLELRRRYTAEPETALGFLRRLVQVEPFDEEARAELLRLLLATRRRREAQGHFKTAERLFQDLGDGSAERLKRVWHELLRDAGQPGLAPQPPTPPAPAPLAPPRLALPPLVPPSLALPPPAAALPDLPSPASGVPAPRPGGVAQERRSAPLVGRDAVLLRLLELLEKASRLSAPQVVLLVGEPGVGKSRLLAELTERAAGLGARALVGHCHDSRCGASYAPWEEALHGLAAVEGEGGPPACREQLLQVVSDAVLGGREDRRLLGLEDIQWMDEASCDLLSLLLRSAQSLPLLVVLTAREGEMVDNPASASLLREIRQNYAFDCHRLLPLAQEEMRQLASMISPESDVERIVALSQGNPLYALELARDLSTRDRADSSGEPGTLREADSMRSAPGFGEQQPLPGSLRELIRDRLERLAPDAGELLRWGSLFNAGVASDLLLALSNLEMNDFLQAVETLERHRLLVQSGVDDLCIFGHELIRQAVYTSLSQSRRRLMHRQIARLLSEEPFAAAANPLDVVHHAAAGGDHLMATRACVAAGKRAARLLANEKALALVHRGLHHAEALPEPLRCDSRIELAEIELSTRSLKEPEAFVRRLEQLAGTALDHDRPEQAWRCYKMMAGIRWACGSSAEARRDTLHAELISRSTSEEERIWALGEAARCLTMLERDLDLAEALVCEARRLSHRLGLTSDAVADANGLLAGYRGEIEEARQSFRQARLLARRRGDRLDEFLALSHLVMLELEQENWEELSCCCEELTALAEKIRPGSEQAFAAALGALCRHVKQFDGDPGDLEEALQRLRLADAKHHLSIVCLYAGRLFLRLGLLERAQLLASEALEVACLLDRRKAQASALSLLAAIAVAAGGDSRPWNDRLIALGPLPAAPDRPQSRDPGPGPG